LRIHYLWGGRLPSQLANAVHVMKMCAGLAAAGHEVTLYHSSPPVASSVWELDELFAQYGLSRSFQLTNISSRPGPFRHLFALQAALRARQRPPADLVYSRYLPAGAWASLLGLPTIQEFHVPPDTASARAYLRMLLAGRGCRKLIVITHALECRLQSQIPMHRWRDVLVEADGVNVEEFRAAAAQPAPSDMVPHMQQRPLIGYVGSLHPGKGAELINPIAQRVPNAQFVVVGGPDELAAAYRDQSTAANITNVAWLGYRPNALVPRYIQACDVLLLPNQPKVILLGKQDIGQWTSPLKLFEYMAAGKIIIASNLPVLTEVLNEGNAVLCDPSNPDEWANIVRGVVQGRVDYRSRATRAQLDVEHYTWVKRAVRCVSAAA
jgi:glycosyltransferase involved in cell wall biosynthesis